MITPLSIQLYSLTPRSRIEMVKKRVPDWLNNSLWSSPHPPSLSQPYDDGEDNRLHRGVAEEADSPVHPPVPEPPPSTARPEHPKVEIRDRINENSDNGSSGSGSSSLEDISRQAQLVQEVSVEPSLLLSLYKHIMYVLYILQLLFVDALCLCFFHLCR